MASTNQAYTHMLLHVLKGEVNIEEEPLYVMACTNDYVPNKNGHEYRSDVTNEVEATGYTAGGQQLVDPTLSILNNIVTLDANDPQWTISGSMTLRYLVYYLSKGDPELDILIGYYDLGENVTTTDNIYRPVVNVEGILNFIN